MQVTTGQVVIRHFGDAPDGSGRKLVAIVGLIAVPDGDSLRTENQYTLVGNADGTRLTIYPETAINRRHEMHGQKIGDMLTEEIWRV